MKANIPKDRHARFAQLFEERSRIREILLLVPAVAFLINLASGHVIRLPILVQGGVGLLALTLAVFVVARSPLFSVSGRLEAFIPIIYDSNKRRFVPNKDPLDLISDPAGLRPFSLELSSKAESLAQNNLWTPPDLGRGPDEKLTSTVADAAFYWLVDTLERDFKKSWARVQVIPAGPGYEIRQEPLQGQLLRLGDVPAFEKFAAHFPRFKTGPLAIRDKTIFIPGGARLDEFGEPNGRTRSLTFRYGGAELRIAVETRGWRTGMPPELVRQVASLAQQGKMDEAMEIQRYYGDVAEISTYFQIAFVVKPFSALGPTFENKIGWVDAVIDSVQRACQSEASYIDVT